MAQGVALTAEYGEANITPQTTMNELRENPSIVGSGLYTYSREQDCTLKQVYWGTQKLEKFSNQWTAQDAAEGLNQLIRNYNAGIQITYPLYTAEEIAQDTSRDVVELYYFPAQGEAKNRKYALVLGGNALITSAEIREGISTAWQMNQMGYTTFVLRYRIGIRAGNNAPMEDVARAVQYITAHAEQFDVQPEQYAVKPGYRILLDPDVLAQRYYDMNVSDYITPDYPPAFFWCGKNDLTLMLMDWYAQIPQLQKAMEKNGVPYVSHVYDNAPHSVSTGRGTDAEGWLNEAVAFWEEQTK